MQDFDFKSNFRFKNESMASKIELPLHKKDNKLVWQMGLFVVVFVSFVTAFSVKDVYALVDHDSHFVWYIFTGCAISMALIWLINILVNVYGACNSLLKGIENDYHFWVRAFICLVIGQLIVFAWAIIDYKLHIESKYDPDLWLSLQYRGLIFSAFSLSIMYSIEKTNEQRQSMNQIQKLREETFQAKYEVLKQQVNPHFLFNSLNILKGMIRTQNEYAEEYLIKLAEVYRYILQSNTKDEILVVEELAMIESYYFMLKNRFPDAIELNVNLSKEALNSILPPLTFQLLLENCVKHNVLTKNRKLIIDVFDNKGFITFRNNLQPKQSLDSANHVGLNNLNSRYEYISKTAIEIKKDDGFFSVILPIVKPKHSTVSG